MILERYQKQPFDRKDYEIDYDEWLGRSGDTLDNVDVDVVCLNDPTDTSLIVAPQITTTRCVLWVEGGRHRGRYKVSVQATTVHGRKDEVEVIFNVKDY